jgi:enamine deaminase RidA (YjgF/YER057c/UK114 family)
MSKSAIHSPTLTPPIGPFSHAVISDGTIYLSGQVGQPPATGTLVAGGVVAETERVLQNRAAVLEACDSTPSSLSAESIVPCRDRVAFRGGRMFFCLFECRGSALPSRWGASR